MSPDPWQPPEATPAPVRAWLGEGPGSLLLSDPVRFTSVTQNITIPLATMRGCSVTFDDRPFWVIGLAIVGAGILYGTGLPVFLVVPWFWLVGGLSFYGARVHVDITAGDVVYTFATGIQAIPQVRALRTRAPHTHQRSSVLDLTVDGLLNLWRPESPDHFASGLRVFAAFVALPLLAGVLVWLPVAMNVVANNGPPGDHLFVLGLIPPIYWFLWPIPALPGLYLWAWLQPPSE